MPVHPRALDPACRRGRGGHPERSRRCRPPRLARSYARSMLILAIILFGMVVGAGAQLLLGGSTRNIDWPMAFVAGLVGSFVGGLLVSLVSGDGIELHASG